MELATLLLSLFSSWYSAWPLPLTLAAAALVLLLWVLFMSVMTIAQRLEAERRPLARLALLAVGLPLLLIGAVVDVIVNATVAWAVFKTPPQEWFLTDRLKKLIKGPRGKARDKAVWFCTHFVEPWDRDHCGLIKAGVR